MRAKSCGPPARAGTLAHNAASVTHAAQLTGSLRACSRIDQWPRTLEILRADLCHGPVSQSRNGAGGVVARILRKGARAHDEQIRHVPALQIAVERARLRIGAHDRASAQMCRLICRDVVRL